MNNYILDSSFLLSLYFVEDINHKKAVNIFSELTSSDIFYINELTYSELLTVSCYKKSFAESQNMKDVIQSLGVFFVNSGTFEYISLFEYLEKRISVVDVSIMHDALKYDCEILSFDKELLNIFNTLKK